MRNRPEEFPLALTVKDVAEIMRVSSNKVYDIARRKDFPSIRDGNRIIIPRDAFFKWMDPTYDREGHDGRESKPAKVASQTTDTITDICVEAIDHAVRHGQVTVQDVVRWALNSRLK